MENFGKKDDQDEEEEQDVVEKFREDCRWIRDGCNFDIIKIFKDGKPFLIDGTHVDPECYISSFLNEETGKYEYRIVTEETTIE